VDKIIRPDGAWDLMERSKTEKKDILWYPKVWHDCWGDNQWEEIMDDVIKLLPKYMPEKQEIISDS